jgi:aspartate aminotransferase-like enzyme
MCPSPDDVRDEESEFVDPLVQTRFDPESDSVYDELVRAVAAVDGTRPVELPPVTESVDTAALEAVLESTSPDENNYLRFRYGGYPVYVTWDGIIAVFPQSVASH